MQLIKIYPPKFFLSRHILHFFQYLFRFPAYGTWSSPVVAPRQLSAVFLLVLALFTSLPLPTILSLLLGLLVSVLHLFALATCGGAGVGIQENENETSGEHFKRVREKEI